MAGATGGAIVGGKRGAIAGAGAGVLGSYFINKTGMFINNKLREKSKKYRDLCTKSADQYRVGAKQMTKEEYINKYGK